MENYIRKSFTGISPKFLEIELCIKLKIFINFENNYQNDRYLLSKWPWYDQNSRSIND